MRYLLALAPLVVAACGPSSPDTSMPADLDAGLRFTLASILRTDAEALDLVRTDTETFPDGCLGIPMREFCADVPTPGYRYLVEAGGQRYEFRAPQADPLAVVLAEAPGPDVAAPVLVYEGYEGHCISLAVSAEGLGAAGRCDAPRLALPLLNETRRHQEWADAMGRFAPFRYEPPEMGLLLRFEGRGTETASPAWQRALLAWAGVVYAEQTSGRSGASWGTAFAWERPTESTDGRCDYLVVERYAVAYASRARCGGGDAEDLGGGWLSDAEWTAFDRWHQTFAAAEGERTHFFGAGMTPMPPDTLAALDTWADAVFTRLAR